MSTATRFNALPRTEEWYSDAFNVDAESGVLEGIVVSYTDTAQRWGFTTSVKPGALKLKDVIVNLEHWQTFMIARQGDSYVDFQDSEANLKMTLKWPEHMFANAAREMTQQGIVRGLSMEVEVTVEDWDRQRDHRMIIEGEIFGVALVSRPGFPESKILKHSQDPRLRRHPLGPPRRQTKWYI